MSAFAPRNTGENKATEKIRPNEQNWNWNFNQEKNKWLHPKNTLDEYVRGEPYHVPRDRSKGIKGEKHNDYKYSNFSNMIDRSSILSKRQAVTLVMAATDGKLTKISSAGLSILNALMDNGYAEALDNIAKMYAYGTDHGYTGNVFGHLSHTACYNTQIKATLDNRAIGPPDMTWAKQKSTNAINRRINSQDGVVGQCKALWSTLPALYKIFLTRDRSQNPWFERDGIISTDISKYPESGNNTRAKLQKRFIKLLGIEGYQHLTNPDVVQKCHIGWSNFKKGENRTRNTGAKSDVWIGTANLGYYNKAVWHNLLIWKFPDIAWFMAVSDDNTLLTFPRNDNIRMGLYKIENELKNDTFGEKQRKYALQLARIMIFMDSLLQNTPVTTDMLRNRLGESPGNPDMRVMGPLLMGMIQKLTKIFTDYDNRQQAQ